MEKPDSNFYLTAKKLWKTVVNKETAADPAKLQQQIELHRRLLNAPGDLVSKTINESWI